MRMLAALARNLARNLARTLARTLARNWARNLACPLARTLACTLACSALITTAFAQQPSSWTISAPKAQPNKNALVARGQEAYQARCIACHGRVSSAQSAGVGTRVAGTQALQARYQGQKPAALEDRTDLNPELVRFFVRKGSGVMPFFRKTEVSDSELDAIAAYLSRR